MSKQPEALRLAHLLAPDEFSPATLTERQAAAELRRLHALNGELLKTLICIKGAPTDFPCERHAIREAVMAAIAKAEAA